MNDTGFEPPLHHFAGAVAQDFAGVVRETAEREGRTFVEQLVQFAIMGAEHSRLCNKTERR